MVENAVVPDLVLGAGFVLRAATERRGVPRANFASEQSNTVVGSGGSAAAVCSARLLLNDKRWLYHRWASVRGYENR